MAIVVKPGKYLIEKTRRQMVGVIALVGTGGSVPRPVAEALDHYAVSIGGGQKVVSSQKNDIRDAMRGKGGWWLILSPSGMRWSAPEAGLREEADKRAIKLALRNSGWSPPNDQIELLVWGEAGKPARSSKKK